MFDHYDIFPHSHNKHQKVIKAGGTGVQREREKEGKSLNQPTDRGQTELWVAD